MNALVKKEIRLLLPALAAGCALASANMLIRLAPDGSYLAFDWYLFSFLACPLVTVILALQSFGAEVDSGTFSALLAQPVSRKTIWNTKIFLLALAFLVMAFFWCAAFGLYALRRGDSLDWRLWLIIVGISTAVIFSGSLWTVLLLRQVAAAFWITVLIPAGIASVIICVGMNEDPSLILMVMVVALSLYSIAGFLYARWLFFQAQDVQWAGTNIALPETRWLSRFKIRSGALRRWSPRAALWTKELQLHQSQFIIAGVLLTAHLAAIVVRKCSHFSESSSAGFILGNLWLVWLLMPLLVGSAAAAEERRLGVLNAQLCLPVSYRTQFMTKIGVVWLLSLLFGAVMPLLLEHEALLHLRSGNFRASPYIPSSHWQFFFSILQTVLPWTPLFIFVGAISAVGLISFYTSSMSRHVLQALSLAVLGVLQAVLLCVVAANPDIYFPPLYIYADWQFFALLYPVSAVTLIATLMILAARNLRQLNITRRLVCQNILVLVSVLGVLYFTIRLL